MDPLSVIAGVTGIVAFTARTTQEVIQLISELRGAPTEINQVKRELENLTIVLQSTQTVFHGQSFKQQDVILLEGIQKCIISCRDSVSALQTTVQQISTSSYGGGMRDKALVMWRWRQHKGDIRLRQDELREAKASLNLSVSVCNGYLTGKGYTEIHEEMERLYQRHSKDFINSDGARGFRRKLEDDLRSVTAVSRPSSIAGKTDGEYAFNLFMDKLGDAEDPMDDTTLDGSRDTRSLLLDAVSTGDSARVLALASEGASFASQFDNGLTILHHCAIYNKPQIASIALDHDANINSKDTHERLTPFQLAMREESWGVAEILVSRGCAIGNFNGEQLLKLLREHSGDLSSIQNLLKLLSERLKNSGNNHDIVAEVVEKNEFRMLQLLLEAGFDPNTAEPQTNIKPIHRAILFQHTVCLKLLIHHGAEMNAYLHPSTQQFLRRGDKCHDELRDTLLPKGVTPLSLATHRSGDVNVSMTKMILEGGADPDWYFKVHESTLLLTICATYYKGHARALIEAGANVNFVRTRTDHSSALYWSIICRNRELAELLLERGADPNAPIMTPALHVAIAQSEDYIATLLIKKGADLDTKDKEGRTPLQNAKRLGRRRIVDAIEEARR
ncbi:ankyrin repeat-containing domain protein [Hypomontagnella monticulosa]|nr:ankyrin repeat-containing domain protein [Hypomontagnella monticulosa]